MPLPPVGYDRDIRHLQFDIRGLSDLKYNLGDCLAIYPDNDPADVEAFCRLFHFDPQQVIEISNAEKKPGLPSGPITLQQLFTRILDITGRPSRRFYSDLAMFAQNEQEKHALLRVRSEKADYKRMVHETMSFLDVFTAFPSARPSLEHLLALLPVIKPRYYSIASSYNADPSKLELCIVVVSWKTPSNKERVGLCTRFISKLDPRRSQPGGQPVTVVHCSIKRCRASLSPRCLLSLLGLLEFIFLRAVSLFLFLCLAVRRFCLPAVILSSLSLVRLGNLSYLLVGLLV